MSDEPLNNEQIEPSGPLPMNTMGSEPSNMPLEAPESPINTDIPVSLKDANEAINEPNAPSENEGITAGEATAEPVPANTQSSGEAKSEPVQATESSTAQIPVNEPLPVITPSPDFAKATTGKQKDLWKRFLDKVQIGKRKKLDKIMTLFSTKSQITNDEVEKFLHVSDATAERYLNILEKENKIRQVGKTGHAVSYIKI